MRIVLLLFKNTGAGLPMVMWSVLVDSVYTTCRTARMVIEPCLVAPHCRYKGNNTGGDRDLQADPGPPHRGPHREVGPRFAAVAAAFHHNVIPVMVVTVELSSLCKRQKGAIGQSDNGGDAVAVVPLGAAHERG